MDTHNPIFKVIIVHEDAVAALQATKVLQQVASNLEFKLGIDVNPWDICSHVWHFEWLQEPHLFEQAVAESAAADLIIISSESAEELPVCVRGWIESVLPRKRGPVALVALMGARSETHATVMPSARYLRQLANQYEVDFLCNAPEWRPASEVTVKSTVPRFEEDFALVPEALSYNSAPRGWGLND